MKINYSNRLKELPPYLFIEMDKKKKKAIDQGINFISLGIGDPDISTPTHIVESMQKAVLNSKNHHYPFGTGSILYKNAIIKWYKKRFNVNLNFDEICALIGSKEGIGHIHLGFVNPGDIVLIPDPGYPVYNTGTIFAGGVPYFMPLLEKNNFLPDLDKIPLNIAKRAKLIFVNYPNNPTASIASKKFYSKLISFATTYNIIVAADTAYSEIYYNENNKPLSFLELPNAKEVGVEFHSLSKTYNMTGWRVGWVCGNKKIISAIVKIKENYDSGVFQAIQEAASVALKSSQKCVENIRSIYKERKDVLIKGLRKIGWNVILPQGSFYVWTRVPNGYTSNQIVSKLFDEAMVIATPGSGMGKNGEGYVRFALTAEISIIEKVVRRITKIKW
ncbi:MAG: LL-diaminopimelate aminotransferase [Endomicrobium sp.]|jgi:LL-diaminopimelate aminotransferase|nr:LL-diaminopimelate aminotransferase [Endomicrobium sp.]